MAAKFDNLDDVNSKFAGTIIYFEKEPVVVKNGAPSAVHEGKFDLHITGLNNRIKAVPLDDPGVRYRDYNLGYANHGAHTAWYYRRAVRQYRQGLKRDQLGYRVSNSSYEMETQGGAFQYSGAFIDMLVDKYPHREQIKELLVDNKAYAVAFHRDFALAYDVLHEDFILEYRGTKIGCSINKKLSEYKLLAEHNHLRESLQEALL